MDEKAFSKQDLAKGAALLKTKRIGQVLFSDGTYQIEIKEPKVKTPFWPFMQLDDLGQVIDSFCSCEKAEKTKSCPHLAAAYLKIFNQQLLPLHVRFRDSLWNRMCQLASRRHGYDASILQKKRSGYEACSVTNKCLFKIQGTTTESKKRLDEILFDRQVETEETSLKFSNLPPEELALWRQGRPSHQLRFELSFWSDLAKWWMLLQEDQVKYTLSFEQESHQLPSWISLNFAPVTAGFYIAEVNWPHLIPTLSSVNSPLPVHEFQQHKIQAIHYDVERRLFLIESTPLQKSAAVEIPKEQVLQVGDWLYVPTSGFFPAQIDEIFNQPEIPSKQIASVLNKHTQIIHKYLVGTSIHTTGVKANYQIFFDANENLHIRCSVFEPGDLSQKPSALFGHWAYIDGKGFYLLEGLLFEGIEKVIKREQMSDFINRHRAWLNGFEGFQTHVYAIESQLRFNMSKDGFLQFEAALDLSDISGEFVDFGEWIFLKGKGFFAKKVGRGGTHLYSGLTIHPSQLSSFIKANREELEQLRGFFSEHSPLEKCGVEIFINDESSIVVRPQFTFRSIYRSIPVQLFGEFSYVAGEGFCEIPAEKRLPEAFMRERTINKEDESYFIHYELDLLKPFVISIQKELIKPRYIHLRVHSMQKWEKTPTSEWLLRASLETEVGEIALFDVWKALNENKKYLFSPAGIILLRPPRFNWLKAISKRKWLRDGQFLKLNTLDWLRLSVLEEIVVPDGQTEEDNLTKQHLETLQTFKTDQPIDLTGFKSSLRTYQEVGVHWLCFLQMHGLSGLLCDEMGLGKTHQAMGLLAATHNKSEGSAKFLVVCPTSVIYHWEELLKRFLPRLRVVVFYGIGRSLDNFKEQADLLLTSYGTLRHEKTALSDIPFDIAIFDEAQIAKNAQSQTHKALKKIEATMRLGLTGTPIENRLLELKSLFDIVLPGYMPQEAQFKEYFVNPIERNQDPERKMLLARLTKPFILRRKKTEVLLELPEKIEEIAYCDLSVEQKELYNKTFKQHKEGLLKDLENRQQIPYMHIFSLFSTLKQICDHPCLITKQFDEFQKHKSGKWDYFIELLHETRDSGQKLVIFSQYLDMLDMFEAYLKEHKIGFAGIRGNTRDRKAQLDKFRTDPQCEVFLASLQAAGVGIDLVSASVVIHYDRWWNPARENQATDRVHRIGQNRGVQVFKMVTKGTIEEHIHQMIERKMGLIEDVISFDEQDQIKSFDRHELLELLRSISDEIEKP